MIKSVVLLCALIVVGNNELWAAEENAVYNELVNQGIKLSNGKTIKFSMPVMADGLTADAQKKVLEDVGPKNNKDNLQRFLRGNPRDWFEVKQVDEKGQKATDSIGRCLDLYFVAQGKLDTLRNNNFVQNQLKAKPKNKTKIEFYNNDELKQRKLGTKDSAQEKQRYAHAFIDPEDLFGEVQVQGSGFGIETLNSDSIVVAFKLDPKFDQDTVYPNQYQKAKTNPAGAVVLDPAKPYSGFGGYAKITKLQGPTDKVFVEYHLIFDEPNDWFGGRPRLASGLPKAFDENVPKFRHNLLK